VEYSFVCVSGGAGCSSSGWQSSRAFTDSGLSANTTYSYTVRARDAVGNMNNASAAASATTDAVQPPTTNISPTAVASYSPNPAQITRGKTELVTLNGAGSYDPDGSITARSWKDQSGSVVSTGSTFSVKLREGNHSYTLTVTDNQGASDATVITVTVLGKQGR
jgi:chitodextrinase